MLRRACSVVSASSRDRRGARGFTLIELMVVVSVAAVLALLAAPSMSNLIAAQRLRSTASNLQLTLVQARSEAIKRNVAVTVSPAAGGWGAGWSILDPENPGGAALQVATVPAGVEVTTAATLIVFNGTGRTTLADAASFVLIGSGGTSRCVSVSTIGRAYAKEGSSC